MKFKKTSVGGTVEILAAADFDAIPFMVTETTAVKAGTPMTLAGKKATFTAGTGGAAGTTTAEGILLYDVDPAENPNAALVVRGVIDQKKAEKHHSFRSYNTYHTLGQIATIFLEPIFVFCYPNFESVMWPLKTRDVLRDHPVCATWRFSSL